jgi:hypothetical protein
MSEAHDSHSNAATVGACRQPSAGAGLSRRRALAVGAGAAAALGASASTSFPPLAPDSAMAAGGMDWLLNVKDYGAVGDGVTDDAPAIQQAIYDATGWDPTGRTTNPSKIVYIPPGTYMLNARLWILDGLTIEGAGRELTTLRLLPTCNGPILQAPYYPGYYVGGSDFTLRDITLDGDAEHTEQTGAIIALLHARKVARWHVARCKITRARGYGVGFQNSTAAGNGPVEDVYFVDCEFESNHWGGQAGTGSIDTKWTKRLTMENCVVVNDGVGFDLRSNSGTLINCHARNCDFGFVLRQTANKEGEIGEECYYTVLGGSAEDCGAGLTVAQTVDQTLDPECVHATIVGFNARKNIHGIGTGDAQPPNPDGAVAVSILGGIFCENDGYGIGISHARMATVCGAICRDNGADGVRIKETPNFALVGCTLENNGQWGVRSEGAQTDRIVVVGNAISGNLDGDLHEYGSESKVVGNATDVAAAITASSTLSLPNCDDVLVVEGSAGIFSITPSRNGRRVTIRYASDGSVIDGQNLKLRNSFNASPSDTITLVCHDGSWYEVSRSAN